MTADELMRLVSRYVEACDDLGDGLFEKPLTTTDDLHAKATGLHKQILDEVYRLHADVAQARQTAEYWKAQHLAGNVRIGELRDGCATLKGCAVLAYDAGQGVAIEATEQADGTKKWAVRSRGEVLGRSGEWEWEPMPSSRDAAFLERCRYATPQEALEVLEHARLHA